jgi:hypothetical protein
MNRKMAQNIVLAKQRSALGTPSDALRPTNRRYDLGRRRARFPYFSEFTVSWCSGANNRLFGSGAPLVGRNARDAGALNSERAAGS